MSLALKVLLIAFCLQGLVKFAVGFIVPYPTRIRRIAAYYSREGRIISIYDTITFKGQSRWRAGKCLMWLAHQLCDLVRIRTHPAATTVPPHFQERALSSTE